jgi:hypothetical protein
MYDRFFKEDILFRNLIINIFNDKISSRPLFLTKKFFKNINNYVKKYNIKLFSNLEKNSFSKGLFRLNKLPNFFSKIHIIRFNN